MSTTRKAPTGKAKASTKANGSTLSHKDPHAWINARGIKDGAEVELPKRLIDEVIGQDEAVTVAKKAARQGRHLLLLGDPGTGKSMIAKAMAEILPSSHLSDVLVHGNPKDANTPRVEVLPGGKGREHAQLMQKKAANKYRIMRGLEWFLAVAVLGLGIGSFFAFGGGTSGVLVMVLALMAGIFFIFVARQITQKPISTIPNLLIERPAEAVPAPYVEATGSHAGALLGDVRHDPFQSGGLETPTHLRVEPGAIHRADKGLLFIDEINVLRLESQQALLTAMQDGKYAITGHSDMSAGAMVRTEAVPCRFILVAAGNMDVLEPIDPLHGGLHPALRSRIRGYGYEVYVRNVMDDTDTNREKLVRFVCQEVRRDGQIPHFTGEAIAEVIREAQRRSGHTGKLTLRLRELGGLVRTAGDIARDEGAKRVTVEHVLEAKDSSMSLEYQVTRRAIEVNTAQEAAVTTGEVMGTATGCTAIGTGETGEPAGVVVPVEADDTVSSDRQKGSLFLGGGLEDANGLQQNLAALVKRLRGSDMAGIDMHVQSLMDADTTRAGTLGAAAAVACVSALEDAPIRQDTVFIGNLAVSGRLRAVDGVTQMVEAAADLGYTRAVVPKANEGDLLLEHRYRGKIEVILAYDVMDALEAGLTLKPSRMAGLEKLLRG